MKNMVKRLESIGGLCEIISAPGNGTSVKLTVRLESGQSPLLVSSQKGGDDGE